ncbi:MAG: hypothetical protein KAH99_02610 [Verrucomicrobia bacterium]|nr:hypothetical protein [Verrucomicrobiota bacterium]
MKRLVLFACLLAMVSGVHAATQYRDFKSAEGKTIRGRITGYNPLKEVVTIERDNRRTTKVPITIFCETDQIYIREWKIFRCFMTDRYFKISAKRKKSVNKEESYQSSYKGKGC